MKNIAARWMTFLLLAMLLNISACSDDNNDGNSEETAFINKLSKTWVPIRVMLDDVDVTEIFQEMEITWSPGKTYSVANAVPPIWTASGVYKVVKSNNTFNIVRDNEVTITVSELTDSKAVLTFQYQAPAGRGTSVSGNYLFEMKAK